MTAGGGGACPFAPHLDGRGKSVNVIRELIWADLAPGRGQFSRSRRVFVSRKVLLGISTDRPFGRILVLNFVAVVPNSERGKTVNREPAGWLKWVVLLLASRGAKVGNPEYNIIHRGCLLNVHHIPTYSFSMF
jgi:hypothetical protein